MRVSLLLMSLFGGVVTAGVYQSQGLLWAAFSVLAFAVTSTYNYYEGRRDGVKEACDYVEKFAKAQKDRS